MTQEAGKRLSDYYSPPSRKDQALEELARLGRALQTSPEDISASTIDKARELIKTITNESDNVNAALIEEILLGDGERPTALATLDQRLAAMQITATPAEKDEELNHAPRGESGPSPLQ